MLNDTSSSSSGSTLETHLTRFIKLILFSVPLGPSLLCSIFIIVCVIYERNLRRRTNHVIISIIVIDFLELMCDLVPITLHYFATGYVYNMSICRYWVIGNYTLQGISSWLMAWASIDRYLIIFLSRTRNTYLRHDGPLVGVCAFVVGWYVTLTFTHPCSEGWFDGTQFLCGGPCFSSDIRIVTADWILIVLIPSLLIVLFNAILLVRVLIQKYRRRATSNNRSFTWRKNRKLLVQLLSIVFVYLVTQLPLAVFSIVRLFGPADFLIEISLLWLFYTPYLIYIIVPFAYVAISKECKKRICQRQHQVNPVVIVHSPQYKERTTAV